MTTYNFDEMIERRGSGSYKWDSYDPDVIPMFVADMDFRSPEPVIQALHERVELGVFGYDMLPPQELFDVLIERYQRLYGWQVEKEDFIFLPNLVNGLYVTAQMLSSTTDRMMVNSPVYWPFLSSAAKSDHPMDMVPLRQVNEGAIMRYEIDFDALEAAITPQTKLFLLCNPHNPVGRVFEKWELEKLAEICLRNDILICSDEIHCDLVYPPHQHTPIATLSPEVEAQTITLFAPSKTFNVPGLGLGFALIPDENLRERFKQVYEGMGVHVGILSITGGLAAYRDGQEWLDQVQVYLKDNRDFAVDYIREHMPDVHVTIPEGTYLLWLDFRDAGLPEEPYKFFLEHAQVALSGNWEPQGFEGCVRLNFGCPRSQLEKALQRLCEAYSNVRESV
ncbi:MAG: PatB family C-S lyase [Anaerolineae bacterium]|nr:PatB family C-S lyase [Anaerolineae bacterium]